MSKSFSQARGERIHRSLRVSHHIAAPESLRVNCEPSRHRRKQSFLEAALCPMANKRGPTSQHRQLQSRKTDMYFNTAVKGTVLEVRPPSGVMLIDKLERDRCRRGHAILGGGIRSGCRISDDHMPDAAKTGHGIARLRYVSAAISHQKERQKRRRWPNT